MYLKKVMIYDIKENEHLKDIDIPGLTKILFSKSSFLTKLKETFKFYEKQM